MSTVFIQDAGDIIEWTAAADVTSNDFIEIGTMLGIALGSCLSGEKVSVKVTGVARLAKDAYNLAVGATVHSTTASNVVSGSTSTLDNVGIALEAAGTGVGTVLVKLTPS
jgi:predicted RecA/RadA family phage recombinase